MSKLYIWKCTVDLSSHTEEELEYYPNYEHIDSYVVVAETADEALYAKTARLALTGARLTETDQRILEKVDERELPLTIEEHEFKLDRYRDGVYPVRWNWTVEQVTPYIGEKYKNGDVLCYSYNAA